MSVSFFTKKWGVSVLLAGLFPAMAYAGGGIVLGGTRIFYPAG